MAINNEHYQLRQIVLMESEMRRVADVRQSDPKFGNNINVEVTVSTTPTTELLVEVAVKYESKVEGEEQIDFYMFVKMLGIFDTPADEKFTIEKFGEVNGAAIIFPFVREHIAALSTKSALGTVLLPPINFTQNNAD